MADTPHTDNPFSKEDQSVNMGIVVDMIEKIVKTPPLKTGDTGRFHIFLKTGNSTKTIVLTAAQLLEGPGKFSTLYFDVFGDILFATKKEWPTFAKYVAKTAIPGTPEETAAVMAGHMLLEKIRTKCDITADKTYLLKYELCNRLVEHSPHGVIWYVMPGSAVGELIDDLPIKASVSDISQAMSACGLKRENTHDVKVSGKPVRCWWFVSNKINPNISDEEEVSE